MELQNMREVPYGVSDFMTVRRDNLYYVDKTMYLPILEKESRNLFFIRPRRFGKSIFISMLHAYYDIRQKDSFDTLFGGLWVGKHPTPLHNRFQVLHLDFSQVGGNVERLEEKFDFYLGVQLDGFVRDYGEYYGEQFANRIRETKDGTDKLTIITTEAKSRTIPSTSSSTNTTTSRIPCSTSGERKCIGT